MSESERPSRPVVDGLIALAAVALAVGLILGAVALIGTKVLGVGGGEAGGGGGAATKEQMSLPPLEKTTSAGGPAFTLNTETPKAGESESDEAETAKPSESKSAGEDVISLQASPLEVGNFEEIDLTGTYEGGEGRVLQVQRKQGAEWIDFAATVAVSGGTFSTYVQTGVNGINIFRVIHKATGTVSNPVKVTVNA